MYTPEFNFRICYSKVQKMNRYGMELTILKYNIFGLSNKQLKYKMLV